MITESEQQMPSELPAPYTIAPWQMADCEMAVALMNACDMAENGILDHPLGEIRADWETEMPDPANAGWVIRDEGDQIVAFGEIAHQHHVRVNSYVFVHPEHHGRGIGTHLLHLIGERAQALVPLAPADERLTMRQYIHDVNQDAAAIVAAAGYVPIRHFWRMEIALTGVQPPAQLPTGLAVRPFVPERDAQAVHATMVAAFRDHWGSLPTPFAAWEQRHLKRQDFDPTQWFVLVDGDEVAGALIGDHDSPTEGWVSTLGVRRPWRGRGVGLALLRLSFAAFAQAGKTSVGLAVDAESPTGATRLYERAGMHVAYQTTVWEKELRPAPAEHHTRIGAFQV